MSIALHPANPGHQSLPLDRLQAIVIELSHLAGQGRFINSHYFLRPRRHPPELTLWGDRHILFGWAFHLFSTADRCSGMTPSLWPLGMYGYCCPIRLGVLDTLFFRSGSQQKYAGFVNWATVAHEGGFTTADENSYTA